MVAIPENTRTTLHAIDEAWEAREAEQPRRGHMGASQIGRPCAREVWLSFRWARQVAFSGRMLRLFDRGQREEAALIESLRLAGVTVHDRDPRTGHQFRFTDAGGHIGGSMDGCAMGLIEAPKSWHVLEFKTASDKYFKQMQRDGVEKSKPEHYVQMQLYMLWSGMTRAYYLVVNKNDDQLYSERVKFNEKHARHYLDMARELVSADTPPQRISADPSWWQCKFCDFHSLCHDTRPADVNCRTCCHATARDDGDARWYCAWHKLNIPMRGQVRGCPDHRFIPGLMPLGDAVDGDQGDNWVEYRAGDVTFRNGEAGDMSFTSRELAAMAPDDLTNETILELRKRFDGRIEVAA